MNARQRVTNYIDQQLASLRDQTYSFKDSSRDVAERLAIELVVVEATMFGKDPLMTEATWSNQFFRKPSLGSVYPSAFGAELYRVAQAVRSLWKDAPDMIAIRKHVMNVIHFNMPVPSCEVVDDKEPPKVNVRIDIECELDEWERIRAQLDSIPKL